MTCWEAKVPDILNAELLDEDSEPVEGENKSTCGVGAAEKVGDLDHMNSYQADTCDNDDWQDFLKSESAIQSIEAGVFNYCFPLKQLQILELRPCSCLFCDYRHQDLFSADGLFCQTISWKFNQAVKHFSEELHPNQKTKIHLNLDLPAECNTFDWSDPKETPILDDMSPIVFKPTLPDSPIGPNFDQGRAIMGLAVLTDCELKKMITEMESKFALTSELLINDLTLRDKLVFGLSVKNKFISALLQVQALRHSNTLSTPSKLESVGRALTSRKSAEDKANFRFLSLVIPYDSSPYLQWELKALQDITETIAEDNDLVPRLLADYIQYVFQSKVDSS